MATVDEHESVLRVLIDHGPKTMDELAENTGLSLGRLNTLLCQLNLAGRIVVESVRRARGKKVTVYSIKERV